jgi:hypothetical protein
MKRLSPAWDSIHLWALRGMALLLIAAVGGGTGHAAEPASPSAGESNGVVNEPVAGRPPVAAAQAESPADLQVRYALARLRLAELDLERALAANRETAGAIGERELERLRTHIEVMQKRLEIARAQPRTASRQAMVAAAEAACVNARGDLDAALRAKGRQDRSVSDLTIHRLRAKLELSEIRLELCQNPEYELSLLDEMQWNIDQLTDEVIDLRHQVETGGTLDTGKPD